MLLVSHTWPRWVLVTQLRHCPKLSLPAWGKVGFGNRKKMGGKKPRSCCSCSLVPRSEPLWLNNVQSPTDAVPTIETWFPGPSPWTRSKSSLRGWILPALFRRSQLRVPAPSPAVPGCIPLRAPLCCCCLEPCIPARGTFQVMRVRPRELSLSESNPKRKTLAVLSDTAVREKERKNQVVVKT